MLRSDPGMRHVPRRSALRYSPLPTRIFRTPTAGSHCRGPKGGRKTLLALRARFPRVGDPRSGISLCNKETFGNNHKRGVFPIYFYFF